MLGIKITTQNTMAYVHEIYTSTYASTVPRRFFGKICLFHIPNLLNNCWGSWAWDDWICLNSRVIACRSVRNWDFVWKSYSQTWSYTVQLILQYRLNSTALLLLTLTEKVFHALIRECWLLSLPIVMISNQCSLCRIFLSLCLIYFVRFLHLHNYNLSIVVISQVQDNVLCLF